MFLTYSLKHKRQLDGTNGLDFLFVFSLLIELGYVPP